MKLAVLLTCRNRREKTLGCLRALFADKFSIPHRLDVLLLDDGSTDGTVAAISAEFPAVEIVLGDGNLFWNRAMHQLFQLALHRGYDAYLWLNDDTLLYPDALERMIAAARELHKRLGHPVIMVGTTVDVDSGMATYGGSVRKRWWKPISFELVTPGDVPIRCDAMNGNCVLVPHEVAAQVGNIDPAFEHAMGDTDYALRTANAGLSVWIAPGVVGFCAQNSACGSFADQALPLRKRLKNMMDPKGLPLRSWLVFTRRHAGPAWPLFWIYPYAKVVLSSLFTKRI